ncbi:MBL fold metallo-hydrolase, partial [Acinetobacter baumannii]
MQQPLVKDFFDENTNTFSYVVADLATRQCAIIDSVLDYDAASATTKTTNADLIVDYVLAQNFKVQWILETHVHADHMTAAQYLKSALLHKDLKCKAPLIEPNLRRNLGKW